MSPERSEEYRREAATRMTESSGHDFAKQKHGYNKTMTQQLWYNVFQITSNLGHYIYKGITT